MRRRFLRAVLGAAVIVLTIAGLEFFQPAARADQTAQALPAEELLAEVRAIRADLRDVAGTSIRTQLLVARLQLQEQRINVAARELSDVRTRLATPGPDFEGPLRSFQEALANARPEERRDIEQQMTFMQTAAAEQRRVNEELRTQATALEGAIASEQVRWLEFNDRLDVIERELQDRARR
jgi:hypothetical protein